VKKIVVGNSLASLTLIDQLEAKEGILWLQDGDKPSGIWSGFKYKNRILDMAMINFEFDLFMNDIQKPIQSYNQFKINDCGRFIDRIKKYILEKISVEQLPEIKIYSDEGIIQDFLFSNNLSDLKTHLVSSRVPIKIIGEEIKLHPKYKYDESLTNDFLKMTLDDYVSIFYGASIRNSIYERWGKRLVGDSYYKIPTLRHRTIWLPLYYPETINRVIKLGDYLSPTRFYYPKNGTVSEFINSLFIENTKSEGVEKADLILYESEIRKVIEKGDAPIVWGSTMTRFFEIMKIKKNPLNFLERGLIDITYYECEISELVSFNYVLLNLSSFDSSWYRLTIMPNISIEDTKKVISIERRSEFSEINYDVLLFKLGFISVAKIKTLKEIPAFIIINEKENKELMESYDKIINQYPNVKFVGNSAYSFASTFNDQIVQSLEAKNFLRGDF
jgi:hypothetical protein